jgi:hypothetical protein
VLITNHVLSGAVLGAVAPDIGQAATLGFMSHFVLDGLPHFGVDEEHLLKVAVPDGLLGLAAIGAIARATPPGRRLTVLAGIFGACLPDLDKPGRQFFGRSPFPRWFDAAHARIQDEEVHRFTVELASAAVFTVALVALLPRRPRVLPMTSRRRPGLPG